jgi:putative spermidine/putrescine transport system substrate-binding protein
MLKKYSYKSIVFASVIMVAGQIMVLKPEPVVAGQFDGQTLRVGTWGGRWGDFQKNIIAPKVEAEGGKVEFVFGSTQDNLAKIAAARGRETPVDVLEILDAMLPIFEAQDLLEKIDLSRVPNKENLDAGFYGESKMGTWIVQEGICYNRDKFKELGLPAPQTYADLGHPKLAGLVTVPDITSGGGLANFAGMVYAAGGDVKNIAPGLELLKGLNVLKYWKRAGEAVNMMQTGDVAAALIYTGWCATIRKSGTPVSAVLPQIGPDKKGVLKNGWIGIVKGTKVPELATFYINQFISTEFQSTWAGASGVIPVSQAAMPSFLSDPVAQEFFVPVNQNLNVDYRDADIPDWTDRWTRTVSK